jgi:hypothetical protein
MRVLGCSAVTEITRAATGRRADAPSWLRWGAIGCAAVALLLVAALFGGALSARRLLAFGVTTMQRRVANGLPVETSEADRRRINGLFGCVAVAVVDGRLSDAEVAPLGRTVNDAFADRALTAVEAEALAAKAEELCMRARTGQ